MVMIQSTLSLATTKKDANKVWEAGPNPLVQPNRTTAFAETDLIAILVEWRYSVTFHLLAYEVLDLRRSGDLAALPNIPTASLNNKSKDNIFIKLVSIFQPRHGLPTNIR